MLSIFVHLSLRTVDRRFLYVGRISNCCAIELPGAQVFDAGPTLRILVESNTIALCDSEHFYFFRKLCIALSRRKNDSFAYRRSIQVSVFLFLFCGGIM